MRKLALASLSSILFLTLARVAGAQAPPPQAAPLPPQVRALIERLDAQAAAEIAKDKLGGVTLGLVSGADLVWTKSYGLADAETKAPAASDTVYRIGSVTKQFTALMLLQLVQAGKVHLSDPVEKYFPEVNKVQGRLAGSPPITLVQLATHTSGLDREPEDTDTYLKGAAADWEKVLIAALPHTRYAEEPGTRFSYSNVGYAILGAALARAAGQTYVDYVRQHVFEPLGMSDTAFEPNDRIRSRLAKGYVNDDGKIDAETAAREHAGRGYKVPNGAVYTTVGDLARFMAFEMGAEAPQVLKKEALEENFARLTTANAAFRGGYGVGFQILRRGDTVLYGHSGGVAGYEAQAFFHRASRTGIIVLRNAIGGPFDSGSLLKVLMEGVEPIPAAAK